MTKHTTPFLMVDYDLLGFNSVVKWFTEFGHLNRGDMLTSEQHRCHKALLMEWSPPISCATVGR